jgi:hypothetical protein
VDVAPTKHGKADHPRPLCKRVNLQSELSKYHIHIV